jgi:two-component system OmpR family sensor kinase
MRSPSLTLRLTAIFTLTIMLACVGISLTLYSALRHELIWRDDQTLINRAAQLRQLLKDGASPRSLLLYFNHMIDNRQDILTIRSAGKFDVNFNQTGVPLPELTPLAAAVYPSSGNLRRWISDTGIEVTALSLQGESEGIPVIITVARVAQERAMMLASYRHKSLMVCLAVLLLCAALSPLLIRRGLYAIKMLSKITAETGSDKLQHPLPLDELPQELLPLGEALNVMRQRLADDFLRLTRFADDLAHELRTPINILLSQNQIALSYQRTQEEYQCLLEGNIEELENLSRLTGNILFLARADHRNVCLTKETFPIYDALDDLTDFLEPVAEEKNISFSLQASGNMSADKILFQRAITNLLTNAIRYAPESGVILVCAHVEDEYIAISVQNQGERLESPEKLFTRFWRGDNARHEPGTGLGLSLVKAIAELHGGYSYYQHQDGNNIFGIRIKR